MNCVTVFVTTAMLILQYDHRISEKYGNGMDNSKHQRDPSENKKRNSPNLEGFNETSYIYAVRQDPDAYKRNAFNQEASDKLPSDRSIPDTRHYRSVLPYRSAGQYGSCIIRM